MMLVILPMSNGCFSRMTTGTITTPNHPHLQSDREWTRMYANRLGIPTHWYGFAFIRVHSRFLLLLQHYNLPYLASSTWGIRWMRGSVKTSASSRLLLENSETIAPSGPA